jgi:hypothetical protein
VFRESGAVMKVSKIVWLHLILCALIVRPAFAVVAQFSIHIATQQDQPKVGQDIILDVTITNISDRTIVMELTSEACDYVWDVRDTNGNEVPESPEMLQLGCQDPPGMTGADMIFPLKPNESYRTKLSMSKWKAISHPGEYTIQLSRGLNRIQKETVVKSNKITISVTQ